MKLICQNMDSVFMHIALFLLSMNFSKNSNHFLFVCLFVYYVVVKMVTAFPIRLILWNNVVASVFKKQFCISI